MSYEDDFDDDGEDASGLGGEDRGCGKRKKGGIYVEVPFDSPYGYPLEHFLVCPPIPIRDPKAQGITPLGVKLIERNGVWHIFDWIGTEHYPNVWDMIEEIRRLGLSRRLPKSLDFSKLTSQSRIILIHSKAHIENTFEFWREIQDRYAGDASVNCPKHDAMHEVPLDQDPAMCLEFCRHDLERDTVAPMLGVDVAGMPDHDDYGRRSIAGTVYSGWQRPKGFKPQHVPAIFASLPLTRLAVVKGNGAAEALEKAMQARVPVHEWDE